MLDSFGRTIDYLRLSVTDRCNLRCVYCMPPEGVPFLRKSDILSYEEMIRLCRIFAGLGIKKIRITGGEPLVRPDIPYLVAALKRIPGIETVALTTNGVLLGQQLDALMSAGLDAVNISIDTLDESAFRSITGRSGLANVIESVERALACSALQVKLNCVPFDGNRSQFIPIAELARDHAISVRFIELMPIGPAAAYSPVYEQELLPLFIQVFGAATPLAPAARSGPSSCYSFPGFAGNIGFISAISHRFCSGCNRLRLTSTGMLKTCLQADRSLEMRELLSFEDWQIAEQITSAVFHKPLQHHFGTDEPLLSANRSIMSQIGG